MKDVTAPTGRDTRADDLPATMDAFRLLAWGEPPRTVRVDVPRPRGEEVLLAVEAAGLCHSDLNLIGAPPGAMGFTVPFTLGHEVVGRVAALGPDADPSLHGTYAVHGVWACGDCRACRRGNGNSCAALTDAIGPGIGRDGGLAEYVLVPSARHLVAATGVAPVDLAPLTDAGLTTFHALAPHRGRLRGAVAVVVGIGGLGHLALQLLASEGLELLVAVDPRPGAQALALELGADVALADVSDITAAVRAALAARGVRPAPAEVAGGVDLVIDLVGNQSTLDAAPSLLVPGGDYVVVGSGGGVARVAKGAPWPRGFTVSAPFWGTHADLVEVVRLASEGVLHAETETFDLAHVEAAYARLAAGEVHGRAVVTPSR